MTSDSSALVRVTPVPNSREQNAWSLSRGFGRCSSTGPMVVLIVAGGCQPLRCPDGAARSQDKISAIILDEFQRIQHEDIHSQVIEVIEGLSDRGADVTVAIVGTAASDQELITDPEYSAYLGRNITATRIDPMTDDEVLDIFARRSALFNVVVPRDLQLAIARISCGYPSVVHQLALQACFSWLARKVASEIAKLAVKRGPQSGYLHGFPPIDRSRSRMSASH